MKKKELEKFRVLIERITPLPIGTKVRIRKWNWEGTIHSYHFDSSLKEYVYQVEMRDGIIGWLTLSELVVDSF